MITYYDAQKIAQQWVDELNSKSPRSDWVIFGNDLEYAFGWMFHYVPRAYAETEDMQYAVPGNAPIFVDRCDGGIHDTGTAGPSTYYAEIYERERTINC